MVGLLIRARRAFAGETQGTRLSNLLPDPVGKDCKNIPRPGPGTPGPSLEIWTISVIIASHPRAVLAAFFCIAPFYEVLFGGALPPSRCNVPASLPLAQQPAGRRPARIRFVEAFPIGIRPHPAQK